MLEECHHGVSVRAEPARLLRREQRALEARLHVIQAERLDVAPAEQPLESAHSRERRDLPWQARGGKLRRVGRRAVPTKEGPDMTAGEPRLVAIVEGDAGAVLPVVLDNLARPPAVVRGGNPRRGALGSD